MKKLIIKIRDYFASKPRNFHQVDANLYRGAQPTKRQMKWLDEQEFNNVINLRFYHGDYWLIKRLSLCLYEFSVKAENPKMESVNRFINLIELLKKRNQKVYIHCKHGSDRTGLMCAVYRVYFQKWDMYYAYEEMVSDTYGWHDNFYVCDNKCDELFIEWCEITYPERTGQLIELHRAYEDRSK